MTPVRGSQQARFKVEHQRPAACRHIAVGRLHTRGPQCPSSLVQQDEKFSLASAFEETDPAVFLLLGHGGRG